MSTKKIEPKSHSLNDIYILLSDKKILNITKSDYDQPDNIIESVVYTKGEDKEQFRKKINRFFLNNEGIYPINLAGPAVTKVIPWNIDEAIGENGNAKKNDLVLDKLKANRDHFQPGYFIDLRQLEMSRLNMIRMPKEVDGATIEHEFYVNSKPAESIPYNYLTETQKTFLSVPEDKHYQLSEIPKNTNLYIAFFDDQDKTHTNTECYSYKVCYIPSTEIKNYIVEEKEEDKKDKEHIKHLKTYYGKTGVQAGALNPYDILSKNDFEEFSSSPSSYTPGCVGGGRGGDGATCYVANLATFKK